MEWLHEALRAHPEIAFFIVLGLGYLFGKISLGGFKLGATYADILDRCPLEVSNRFDFKLTIKPRIWSRDHGQGSRVDRLEGSLPNLSEGAVFLGIAFYRRTPVGHHLIKPSPIDERAHLA